MFGVGATIGTGIFIILTDAVPEAGPAVIVSFVLAGLTAALTAVCYAELASTIPVSGSSYSYTYATMGEIVAFGVAACLLLEYGVSSASYLDAPIGNRKAFSNAFGGGYAVTEYQPKDSKAIGEITLLYRRLFDTKKP